MRHRGTEAQRNALGSERGGRGKQEGAARLSSAVLDLPSSILSAFLCVSVSLCRICISELLLRLVEIHSEAVAAVRVEVGQAHGFVVDGKRAVVGVEVDALAGAEALAEDGLAGLGVLGVDG